LGWECDSVMEHLSSGQGPEFDLQPAPPPKEIELILFSYDILIFM
jgi:hypothetical protein